MSTRQLELWNEEGEREQPAGQATVNDATRQLRRATETLIKNESHYISLKRVSLVFEGSFQGRPTLTSTAEAKAFFAKYWIDNQ